MAWGVLALSVVAIGLSRLPLWALFVVPGIAVVIGLVGLMNEPSNYDMRGASLVFGGGAGLLWLCVSLGARGLRNIVRDGRRGTEDSPRKSGLWG